VAVDGDGAVIVGDADPVAEAGGRAGVDNGALLGGDDRGTERGSEVDALVHGAPADLEAGGVGAVGRLDRLRCTGLQVGGDPLLGELHRTVELAGEIGDLLALRDRQDLGLLARVLLTAACGIGGVLR
jgi:hypothetical protein